MQLPDWTQAVHHDGSELYVSNPLPASDERVTLWLRTPRSAPIERVYVRTLPDGEGHWDALRITRSDALSHWWSAEIRVTMPVNTYRFKLFTADTAYFVNALGVSRVEAPELFDFKLIADYAAPLWAQDSVFYHIFVDRFYNGDPSTDVPPGAWMQDGFTTQRRPWGSLPLPWNQTGALDFYGGDLPGIAQKLDYLQDLGVNTVYLTPIFTANSNHRYDTLDFDNVDPHIGGNQGLADLRAALDRAGMHLVLDVVVNHLGSAHPWFKAAQADAASRAAEYFTFYRHPDRYEQWLGISTLVKLNYRSEALQDALIRRADSVLRRWLQEPYRIDGWRLDVFHMMARQGRTRMEHKIARAIRRAVKGDNPQAYLLGEHSYDGTSHLQGDELDATMNYEGFSVPLRRWLSTNMGEEWPAAETDPTLMSSEAVIEQWKLHLASIPWVIARQQYHMLNSHDMSRIQTVMTADKRSLRAAVALLMTFPGIPTVYYGDEIGLEGGRDPDNRRTFPWDPAEWDHDLRRFYQTLIHLRRTAPALVHGGLQMLTSAGGLIAFQRQSREQQLIVIGYRGPGSLAEFRLPVWPAGIADGAALTDLLGGAHYTVADGALTLRDLQPGAALVLEVAAPSA